MARKPVVAGMFYESEEEALKEQIKGCFLSNFGPGKLPEGKKEKTILGAIAPHAGYIYSGACAAHSYKEIAESKSPDLFILLGLSHSGYRSCISLEDWETPLGIVKNDNDFGKALMENTGLKQNEAAHRQEHSIEVQLPFLQFINKNDIKIVPIIASPDVPYDELAKNIAKTIKQTNKKTCIIASSDFTHYGINYGYFPFQNKVKDNLNALDNESIENIKELKALKFLDYTEKTGATICGKYPIAVMMETCRLLGGKKAKLLKYYTSGDVVNDYSSAVGYASIIVE
jgi:AmmeMemoRadiSam system protein B